MAEFINKKDAIAQIKSIPYATQEEVFFMSVAVSRLRKMPTVTEADIRAKAIDEVLETLSKYDDVLSVIPTADLQGIICVIEQLKERE